MATLTGSQLYFPGAMLLNQGIDNLCHKHLDYRFVLFFEKKKKDMFEAFTVMKAVELRWRDCWNYTELFVLCCQPLELREIKQQTLTVNFIYNGRELLKYSGVSCSNALRVHSKCLTCALLLLRFHLDEKNKIRSA